MVATLFQHCYSVLRKNSSLRIVPCNIASTLTAWISISLFHLASRFTAFFVSSRNASCGEERCVTRDDYYLANLVRKKGLLFAQMVYSMHTWHTSAVGVLEHIININIKLYYLLLQLFHLYVIKRAPPNPFLSSRLKRVFFFWDTGNKISHTPREIV